MEHRIFKLGKGDAKHDERNLMFAAIAKPVSVPAEYDFDVAHCGIPTPMFANDNYGCCVIAGRAHQTIRFEDVEQGGIITITDAEVLNEYFEQSGGGDTGLIVLDSLKQWRKRGWVAGGRRYKIKAFSQLNPRNHTQVMAAIYSNIGVGVGFSLPLSAQTQIDAGKPWAMANIDNEPGSWGGHYVFCPGYTVQGPVCVTWGRKQQVTWSFWDRYCDEAYSVIDEKNSPLKGVDLGKVEDFLRTVN